MDKKELESTEQNINEKEQVEEVKEEVETPKEEAKAPEKNEAPQANAEYEPFDKDVDADIPSSIEEKRNLLLATYKKSRLMSRIFMIIVVALVIAAIIIVPQDGIVFKILGYSLAGVALAAMLVFYFKTKNIIPNHSRVYMKEVTKLINALVFAGDDFKELQVSPNKKLTRIELSVDRIYKEGIDIGSRNAIKGLYKDHQFEVTELAVYYPSENRKNARSVGFLGKYIVLSNKLEFDGRYIFNYKASDEAKVVDQPNDTEDLEKIYDEDHIEVYGKDKKEMNSLFGTDFLKKLKEFEIGSPLLNLSLVIWGGHTAVYLSYDDSVTTLPFEHEFNQKPQEQYRGDLIRALDLLTKF